MCVRFGLPFVLHLEKTVAWDLLQKEILEKMKYFLRPTVCIQVRMLRRRLKLRPVRWGPGPEPQRGKPSLTSLRAELQDRGRSPRCAKGAGRCRVSLPPVCLVMFSTCSARRDFMERLSVYFQNWGDDTKVSIEGLH